MGVIGALLLAQVTVQAPGMKVPQRVVTTLAELRDVASGEHDRTSVTMRGWLAPMEGDFLALEDGTSRVMVIPAVGAAALLREMLGREVQVDGFVRRLYERQGTCLERKPQSHCDDPDLPPTPDRAGRAGWPRMSITVWSAVHHERETGATDRHGSLADLFDGAEPDRPLTVRGRFCGTTLCGLPPAAAPERGAWRIADGDVAIWVLGRPPRGKGWKLDPAYEGDASRWVDVTGTVVPCGGDRCLKASKVELAPAPRPPAP